MDIKVTGRHMGVSDDFEARVHEKLERVEKLAPRAIRIEVQVAGYGNRRHPDEASRVEITLLGKGPVIRAEAHAQDKYAALDRAVDRLVSQLRKAADRKKVRRGQRNPQSLHDAMADMPVESVQEASDDAVPTRHVAGMEVTGDGPLVVREKTHEAAPMSLDQALTEMELVGHDWYLFVDAESGRPSVVYRRKAYDYGVIHLDVPGHSAKTA